MHDDEYAERRRELLLMLSRALEAVATGHLPDDLKVGEAQALVDLTVDVRDRALIQHYGWEMCRTWNDSSKRSMGRCGLIAMPALRHRLDALLRWQSRKDRRYLRWIGYLQRTGRMEYSAPVAGIISVT